MQPWGYGTGDGTFDGFDEFALARTQPYVGVAVRVVIGLQMTEVEENFVFFDLRRLGFF